jgi:hypothetical protein
LYLRPAILRNGVLGIGAANVSVLEQSGGITGFYDAQDARTFHPQPKWINRLAFFDLERDTKNAITNRFIADLAGPHIGASVCQERVIDDPDPGAADASPDGKVHGLRTCAPGDWIRDRHGTEAFALEQVGFFTAIQPLVRAFVSHGREDLFVDLATTASNHWADDKGTPSECKIPGGGDCAKSGIVSYEPLIAEVLHGDLLASLSGLARTLSTVNIAHCESADGKGGCARTSNVNGIDLLARVLRASTDPDVAKQSGLVDRRGSAQTKRNDGTVVPQVTGLYLLSDAVKAMDVAFDSYTAAHPENQDRLVQWRRGRSGLFDHFLHVEGDPDHAHFVSPAITRMGPTLLDLLRQQLWADCPKSFAPPYEKCTWLRQEVTQNLSDIVSGPLFSSVVDLGDAIRRDEPSRTELEEFVDYLANKDSPNNALFGTLVSVHDAVQLLHDDQNLYPFYKVLAEALVPSSTDEQGRVVDKGFVDAATSLLARISGKYTDATGARVCSKEVDPNAIVAVLLKNNLTPFEGKDGVNLTPLEVLADVVADMNKVAPEVPMSKLTHDDYRAIADNINDFLTNKERGLEQLYEVIRQSTIK